MDFQFDVDERSKAIKTCLIVVERTRVRLGGLVEQSITAERFITILEELVAEHGTPMALRSDNGPAFISHAHAHWTGTRAGLSCIPPSQP